MFVNGEKNPTFIGWTNENIFLINDGDFRFI